MFFCSFFFFLFFPFLLGIFVVDQDKPNSKAWVSYSNGIKGATETLWWLLLLFSQYFWIPFQNQIISYLPQPAISNETSNTFKWNTTSHCYWLRWGVRWVWWCFVSRCKVMKIWKSCLLVPHLSELNDLVRDFDLPKEATESLGSSLSEEKPPCSSI